MTTRFPYHKALSISRSVARANRFTKEWGRGQFRGRSKEQIKEMGRFYEIGLHLLARAGAIDILVSNVVPSSDTTATFDLSLRCLACGGPDIEVPEDDNQMSICCCRSCGANVGQFGDVLRLAQWLALDEARLRPGPDCGLIAKSRRES